MSTSSSVAFELSVDLSKFQAAMSKAAAIADQHMRQINNSIGSFKTALGSFNVADKIGAAFDTVKGKIEDAISSAAGIQQLSERTGVAAESLSTLSAVAKLSNTDNETLATGLQKLSKSMIDAQNGSTEAAASFRAIGISIEDIQGKSPDQVFTLMAQRLAEYQDGAEKTIIAQNLLGESGANLLPTMNDLVTVGDLQLTLTQEQIEAAAELHKNQLLLQESTDAIYQTVAMECVPAMNAFVKTLLDSQNANDGVRQSVKDLAADGSIRQWAEGAAMLVGYVVDAFDGVARTVLIVGKGIGAIAAHIAMVVNGEANAVQVLKDYGDEIDKILSKPQFSDKLKANIEAARNAPPKSEQPTKPRIDVSGLGAADRVYNHVKPSIDNKRAIAKSTANGAANDDDAANKKLKAEEAAAKVLADLTNEREKSIKQSEFEIDMLGRTSVEVEKLTAKRRIELDVAEKIAQLKEQDPNVDVTKIQAEAELYKEQAMQKIQQTHDKKMSAGFGATEAIRKYGEEATNVASQIESVMTKAFKGAEDALVNFAMTGKLSFGDLAKSIMADMIRIQVRAAISGITNWLGNLASNAISSFFGGGNVQTAAPRANGGPVYGGSVYLVGERGPEIFTPASSGNIIPNHALGGALGGASRIEIVHRNEGTPQKVTSSSADFDGETMVISIVTRDIEKNGRISQSIAKNFGANRAAGAY